MNNLFKFLIGIILVLLALAFFAFAVQNSADILIVLLPELEFFIPLYLVVLGCFAAGFMLAVVITRFEYLKTKFSLFRILNSLKSKSKSKYIEE